MRQIAIPDRTDPVPVMRVNLEPSAGGIAFAVFRHNSASSSEIGLLDGTRAADFWFRATLYQSPHALAFRAASNGHTNRRGPEQIALGNDEISMFVLVHGESRSTVGDQVVRERPGDIFIRDYAQPFDSILVDYDAMILTVPRDRLPASLLTLNLHCANIPAGEGAARLIAATLAKLLDTADALSIAEFESAVDGIWTMAAGALRSRTALASDEAVRARGLAVIEQHLHEPNFGPAQLASLLGVSRSSLYRLFKPMGGVGAVILRRRLEFVVQSLLSDQAGQARLVGLARKFGFSGSDHLTRAFRKRFGLTPRAFKEMLGRQSAPELIAQAKRAGFASLPDWLAHAARQHDSYPAEVKPMHTSDLGGSDRDW